MTATTNATTSRLTTTINEPRVRCSNWRFGCWRGRAVFGGVRSGRSGAPAGRPVRTLPVIGYAEPSGRRDRACCTGR